MGAAGGDPPESRPAYLLPSPGRSRLAQEGRAHRLCAQTTHDPECHDANEHGTWPPHGRPENIDFQDSCYRLDAVNVRRTARGCASNLKSTPDIFAPGASTTVCTAGDAGVHRAGTLEESMWTRYSPAGSAVNSNSPSPSVTVILYRSSKMMIRLAPGTAVDRDAADASVAPPDGSNTRTRPRSLPNRTRGKDVTAVPRFATSICIVRREPMSHH